MPEIRYNPITSDWVIIATERAKRPHEFIQTDREKLIVPAYRPDCPFCFGNEDHTPDEIYRLCNDQGWRVRIVSNKYPALSSEGERQWIRRGFFRTVTGVGHHDVVIEHPDHNAAIAGMNAEDVLNILRVYRTRYQELRQDPRVKAIVIFKNHGMEAGTSLEHPHSQIAATPIVPTQFRDRLDMATRFFDTGGECLFCRVLEEELATGERIVAQNADFVAFIPYAALSPFHLWIFPRRHISSFDSTADSELASFASILREVTAKIYYGLGDPAYNFTIRSSPTDEHQTDYFHWYLAIVPRVSRAAGFEMGSGMYINTSLPEASAEFLRSVIVPS
ncbi:MAG TPA: galactose-1-phosphate uridylyltransferase [Leptolyngbyaceae cyanobacterium M33_DOE_097]|uniref:Galactose-1-phosphate uridylyltransferase n=1 Tax=Oscillatoriales cyanobacterium SpSt-418 TaxID=2282169 RepID=A0A7C3PQK4_9CYAN|nr:galactose-1-phosphate uridylyltransferase [Leptolyngbyaceae cyanobacterium M33_DOE_097]